MSMFIMEHQRYGVLDFSVEMGSPNDFKPSPNFVVQSTLFAQVTMTSGLIGKVKKSKS